MTNADLLNRINAVNTAIEQDAFSSTKINYALTSNLKRLQEATEPFHDEMEDLREEYQEELQEVQERRQELQDELDDAAGEEAEEIQEELQDLEAPEEFTQARQELLEMEVDFEPYNVNDRFLDDEEDVPIQLLYQLDFIFSDSI